MAYPSYYGDDDFDYNRRGRSPRPHYGGNQRSQQYLNPGNTSGLYRSRSHGASPQPVINNIYMDQMSDAHMRTESPYRPSPPPAGMPPPPPPPPVSMPYPGAYPQPAAVPYVVPAVSVASSSPHRRSHSRSRSRLGDELLEQMAEMQLQDRLRSRSRGRTEGSLFDRPDFAEWKLEQREKEIEEERRRKLWEKEAELKKLKAEHEAERAEHDAEESRKRAVADFEKRKRDEADKAKAERAKILADMEREKAEAKEQERRILEKADREKREAEQRKKREYEEFLREQKEKEEKAKAEKKAKKEEVDNAMRERFRRMGYSEDQIDVIIDEEKLKESQRNGVRGRSPGAQLVSLPRAPVYAKVHRDYLSVETLRYYEIPFEFDRNDSNYIIIMREMDKYETEVLFEHTKRLRAGKLLIEAPKDEKKYAWYRKRDRSSSRVRKVGILEYKKVI